MRRRRSVLASCSRTRTRFTSVRSSFRSASLRLVLNRATPAASSRIFLRSVGLAFNIAATRPCSIMEYAFVPMPVSRNSSRISFNRTLFPLIKYSLLPSRNNRLVTPTSSVSTDRNRLSDGSLAFWLAIGLSNVSVTDAAPNGLRTADPAKITSSIASPRKLFAERSPRTHLIASTTFDLPQPFGPTMPIIGSSKRNSVESANDLKPAIVILDRRI